MKAGDYIYIVRPELIGSKLVIQRQVLLEYDPKADRYAIGESKMKESVCSSGPLGNGIGPLYATTPYSAVNKYVSRMTRANEKEIEELEKKIETLKKRNEDLLELDHTTMKVKSYPDDWTPVDF